MTCIVVLTWLIVITRMKRKLRIQKHHVARNEKEKLRRDRHFEQRTIGSEVRVAICRCPDLTARLLDAIFSSCGVRNTASLDSTKKKESEVRFELIDIAFDRPSQRHHRSRRPAPEARRPVFTLAWITLTPRSLPA